MQLPLQISFHGLDRSDALEANVREHATKLEEFCDRVTSCHVVLEKPHKHHRRGNVYHVRIHVAVPRRELVVDREPAEDHAHEDPYVTVRDAFKAMRRQLEDYSREMRGDVKVHAAPPHGRVKRLVPEGDYGVIETPEGKEVYFHRHSVLDDAFAHLEIGSAVTFVEEQGEKGPQASTVRMSGHDSHLRGEARTTTAARSGPTERTMTTAATKMTSAVSKTQEPRASRLLREETIRLRAYERWEAAGRPAGDGVRFWLEAERELMQTV
jgi:cold shock CspA family protein/ribosome-associated translation inhibitor RaiA